MPLADLTREAVLRAISEYDALGNDSFLNRYGYRPARSYLLVHEGRHYPSKAIAGVAHGYVSIGYTPLHAGEFSGGDKTVARALQGLGFEVVVAPEAKLIGTPYEAGRTYSRRNDIHGKFGGNSKAVSPRQMNFPSFSYSPARWESNTDMKTDGPKGPSFMWGKGNVATWSLFVGTRQSETMPSRELVH